MSSKDSISKLSNNDFNDQETMSHQNWFCDPMTKSSGKYYLFKEEGFGQKFVTFKNTQED